MQDLVVLGLGSNRPLVQGLKTLSCCNILQAACTALSVFIKEPSFSSVYKTRAMYVENQDDFYNMAVAGLFSGTPHQLLQQTQALEAKFGRNRKNESPKGPRTLDIDIELFGDFEINDAYLTIPHRGLSERAFILRPMLEIWPKSADTVRRVFYESCLQKIGSQAVLKFCDPFTL